MSDLHASGVGLVLALAGALVLGLLVGLVLVGRVGRRVKWHFDWVLSIGHDASGEARRRAAPNEPPESM